MAHLFRVICGRKDCFCQQRQGADRRLEFMADIGNEIAAHGIYSSLFRQIVDEDQQHTRSQWGHAHTQLEKFSAERWTSNPHLLFTCVAIFGHLVH